MKATIVLLADIEAENFGRKYMLEANRVGAVGFETASQQEAFNIITDNGC